jgi:hypothetical protein
MIRPPITPKITHTKATEAGMEGEGGERERDEERVGQVRIKRPEDEAGRGGEVTIPPSCLESLRNSIEFELVRQPLDCDDGGRDH